MHVVCCLSSSDMEPAADGGITRVQISGILLKQPFGPKNQSTKWTKRFFVLKDGYLLYYLDSDKKDFDRKQFIHLHPKGILPMGGCSTEPATESGHPFCIRIKSTEINNEFVLSAESDYERNRWLNAMVPSTRITWVNAQLGDATIKQLERQGLQLSIEKQEYADRLRTETLESCNYKEMAEELQKLNEELTKENSKLEQLVHSMNSEHEGLNKEMEETMKSLSIVDKTKISLQSTFGKLESNLKELETQKISIAELLEAQVREARKLTAEKQSLSNEADELSRRLAAVEDQMKRIADEKEKAEQSLKEQEMKAEQLQEDKRYIEERAEQLQISIQELNAQKSTTEAELQGEIQARMEAEKRLAEAEKSLFRLEELIQQQNENQMMSDVKTLKHFFENLAFESKLDARKCLMIKQSIEAKKAIIKRSTPTAARGRNRQSLSTLDETCSSVMPRDRTSSQSSSSSCSMSDDLSLRRSGGHLCGSTPGVRSTVIGLSKNTDSSQPELHPE